MYTCVFDAHRGALARPLAAEVGARLPRERSRAREGRGMHPRQREWGSIQPGSVLLITIGGYETSDSMAAFVTNEKCLETLTRLTYRLSWLKNRTKNILRKPCSVNAIVSPPFRYYRPDCRRQTVWQLPLLIEVQAQSRSRAVAGYG